VSDAGPGAAGAGAMAVDVRAITRRFADLTAVDSLSFAAARGELLGVVGPDGAGKTTLLRMLAGVLRPSGGDAVVFGTSVVRDPERVKQSLAYMSQRFGLYADLTVLENIDFYADLYEVPRDERARRLQRLFHFSNLGPFRDRLAGKLSGGMKQKLSLCCALIHQPQLLLLDEPTFGVDPVSRRDLWLIVHDMVSTGMTAIVSTAYMDEAERFDRVVFLHRGRVLALDSPDALREGLTGEILAVRLEHARTARDAALRHPGVRLASVFGDRLHVTVDAAATAAPALRAALEREGHAVRGIERVEPSMEDVFLDRIAAAAAASPRRPPAPSTA
jgi:ABC-2 type transport system ATP-binding protein